MVSRIGSSWSVVDGGYTNGTFFKHLPERTSAVGRIRADAKLYHLPEPTEGKPGRNRVYGERAPTPEELRQDASIPWQEVEAFAAGKKHHFKIKTLAPLRWRPAGKNHDLRLIVIAPLGYRLTKHSRVLYRKPAYLICTDPNASIQELLQAYIWRWDIEVNFRDEKTLLGVGQAQVRHERSVENVPAFAVAAYAMLLTAAIQAFGQTGKPDSLPSPKWRRKKCLRASTQFLIQTLRHEVWAQAIRFSSFASPHTRHAKPQKLDTTLESACSTLSRDQKGIIGQGRDRSRPSKSDWNRRGGHSPPEHHCGSEKEKRTAADRDRCPNRSRPRHVLAVEDHGHRDDQDRGEGHQGGGDAGFGVLHCKE